MNVRLVMVGLVCVFSSAARATQPIPASDARLPVASIRRTLSFEDRVAAQAAIERVYYRHQIGATKPFEEAVPRQLLEKKVRTYLKQSAALEGLWKTPITAEMIDGELGRMARQTRMPDRLRELFHAVGDDAFLFEECLVRPALVDRLARSFFAFDDTIHGAARTEAEALRARLVRGELRTETVDPRRFVAEFRKVDPDATHRNPSIDVPPPPQAADSHGVIELTPDEFAKCRASVPGRAGTIGPLEDGREAFLVRTLLSEDGRSLRVATYAVPKVRWDSWWTEHSGELAEPDTKSFSVRPRPLPASVADVLEGPCRSGEATAAEARMDGAAPRIPDDTWDNGILDDFPAARAHATAVWTGSVMVVWGGITRSFPYSLDSGARYDPATDTWAPISRVNAPAARAYHTAVWTGGLMLVWGGSDGFDAHTFFDTGGRYDPTTDTWTPMSTVNAPVGRWHHSAIWTGRLMVVWGGDNAPDSSTNRLGTGGRYDPASDSWMPTSAAGAPSARTFHTAVWTGGLMVVWGGEEDPYQSFTNTGGRYDPVSDTWTPTSTSNALSRRGSHTAVWTGSLMVAWGGYDGAFLDTGGRYDPIADTWSPVSTSHAPAPRVFHSSVWTGSHMLVWGGGYDQFQRTFNSGGRYDPASDSWTPMSTTSAPSAREAHTAVWTGNLMVVWGGDANVLLLDTGGRYDPATDTWTPTATGSAPSARENHTAVWTGTVMIVWGGENNFEPPSTTGGRYDPVIDTWTPTSTLDAPSARRYHTAVWTGHLMVVWGGLNGFALASTGGRYDPVADTWTPTSTVNAPTARYGHTAVWTGNVMVAWGGIDGSSPNGHPVTGGRYDPASDSWTPTSTANAPGGRERGTVVWTGRLMLVWGGYDDSAPAGSRYLNNGGRYDSVSDSWSPISQANAPSARSSHSAVWTGSVMVVWGGVSDTGYRDTGGRYDPATDTWTPTSTAKAPEARVGHTAVWTGSRMVVWAGLSSTFLNTGGRYDPERDTWTATSTTNAPPERVGHTAVWADGRMIVWGGLGSSYFRTGGRYGAALNHPPVAVAGPDRVLECEGSLAATAHLDGSLSSDPDSIPGTNDDIAGYSWSEGGSVLASTMTASVPFHLGAHDVTLTVTDKDGATGTDATLIAVRDTHPPVGSIVAPSATACFGPAALPVTVMDDFTDVCDPTVLKSYDPAPGPSYSQHGDYHITLTAKDTSNNAAAADVDFTIDTKPPIVNLLRPVDRALLAPTALPFAIVFHDTDDDGAAGGVIREVVKLQGCTIYDGLTYGNRDGLLSDETLTMSRAELCRLAASCGFTMLVQPEIRVEARDCGGNVGVSAHRFEGSIALRPGICGN
jgi:N-acetylneuraminic acid mutarotase